MPKWCKGKIRNFANVSTSFNYVPTGYTLYVYIFRFQFDPPEDESLPVLLFTSHTLKSDLSTTFRSKESTFPFITLHLYTYICTLYMYVCNFFAEILFFHLPSAHYLSYVQRKGYSAYTRINRYYPSSDRGEFWKGGWVGVGLNSSYYIYCSRPVISDV